MASKKSKAGYDGKIAGLYDLEETIGRGHFAVVKLARHVFTGEKVAVKVIDKTKLDEVSRSHLFQEVRCMKLVQHPNVVRLYEVIDTQTKLYLILELGDGGDMYDYIMRHTGGLEEKLAKRYFRQIVEAISYCHKLHVVHRDLKPENVVFFEKLGLVKLTDFGFSNMFAPGKKLETSCGSLAYSAPEILLGDSYDAPAVDVWSLGVILYMLVVGEPPFQEANDSETLTMIMDCRYHIPPSVSDKCRDLIGKMLQREPVNRASLPHIMAHPWLNDGDLTPVTSYLPLITKEMISEEDQTYVVQRMVEGKIASREEILTSIEKNSYNHITATFYLLIERRLRKHQQHEYHLIQQQPSSGSLRKQSAPSPSRSAKPHLEPLMLSPRISPLHGVRWNGLSTPSPQPVGAGSTGADVSIRQRVLESLETPGSPPPPASTTTTATSQCARHPLVEPAPSPPQTLPLYVVQGIGEPNRDVGTSHYVQSVSSPTGTPPPSLIASPKGGSPLLQSPSDNSSNNLLAPPGTVVTRKCSLIREESLDEYDDDDDDDVEFESATIKPVKSLESLDELGSAGHVTLLPASPPAATSPPAAATDSVNPRRPLKSVCSSPQLLNQIHEENESEEDEEDDDVVPLKLSTPRRCFAASASSSSGSGGHHRNRGSMSPEMLRKYEQRKKRRGAGQRGTSCSSSDASDTDDTERRRSSSSRKEKLHPHHHHKFVHRRDSSDHSSDTDGPGGTLGGGGGGGSSNGRLGAGSGSRGGGTSGGGSRTQGGGGRGDGRGDGKRGGGGGSGGGEKKNSDNRNHSSNNNNNNKNSVNNHKNSQYHGGGGGGGSKGSLTDSSLKLLSRKLNEISTGVGVLLSECRGSDTDSPIHHPHHPSSSTPPLPPRSLEGQRSASSGSLHRHGRNNNSSNTTSSSLRSNVSSSLHPDSHLFPLNEQFFSPVQYLGQSGEAESIGGLPPLEFSELSQCVSGQGEGGLCSGLGRHPSPLVRQCGAVGPCAALELPPGLLHCKPQPGGGAVLSSKSKCCSVV